MINELKLFRTGNQSGEVTLCYLDADPVCSVCGGEIFDHGAVYVVDWTKEGRKDTLMHFSCVENYRKHPLSMTQYRWQVLFTDSMPRGGVPIFVQPPTISDSRNNVTVFEPDKLKSDKTKDNAWRSKRFPSLEGATVGSPDALEKIESREREDQALLEADPAFFLDELKKSSQKAVLEHNKDLLEDDRHE